MYGWSYTHKMIIKVRAIERMQERTYEFFHDSHFCLDVVESICLHVDSFSPQTRLVHNFHSVHLVVADIEADEDLGEGAYAYFLHDLVLVDPFFAADFS